MDSSDHHVIPFPDRGVTTTDEPTGADLAAGALKSGWLTQGTEVQRLQDAAEELLKRPVVPVAGGSAALHLTLLGLDLSAGGEVVLPGLVSAAVANLVIHVGGHPVFADIEAPDRPFLDAADANRLVGPETRALLTVHEAGYPAPTEALALVAAERSLTLIEDGRQALGTTSGDRQVGTAGDAAAFAFADVPNGGGLVACATEELRRRIEAWRSAVIPTDDECFSHDCVDTMANGYRIDEAAAAAGLRALRAADDTLRRRRDLAESAARRLSGAGFTVVDAAGAPGSHTNWRWLIVLADSRGERDELLARLRRAHIDATLPLPAVAQSPHNARLPRRTLPNLQSFCDRALEVVVVPRLAERLATLL